MLHVALEKTFWIAIHFVEKATGDRLGNSHALLPMFDKLWRNTKQAGKNSLADTHALAKSAHALCVVSRRIGNLHGANREKLLKRSASCEGIAKLFERFS